MELTKEMARFLLGHFRCWQPASLDCQACRHCEICRQALNLLKEIGEWRTLP